MQKQICLPYTHCAGHLQLVHSLSCFALVHQNSVKYKSSFFVCSGYYFVSALAGCKQEISECS